MFESAKGSVSLEYEFELLLENKFKMNMEESFYYLVN